MDGFFVVILIILCIIILIVLVRYFIKLWSTRNRKSSPRRLGHYCDMTSDCQIGLTCDQSVCKIPIAGSCVNREDMCAESGLCVKGMCKIKPIPVTVEASPQLTPIIKMEVKGAPSPVIISKLETPKIIVDDYEETFHRLALQNGKVIIHDKNIIDASLGKDETVWFITKTTINSVNQNGSIVTVDIAGDNIAISCQAFNKVCYVLVKNQEKVFSIQKFNLDMEVEYPHFPIHEHVAECINIGTSEAGLIMIVTKQSIISFNPNTLKDNLSSWYVDIKDNKNILYMNYINGKLFSIDAEKWYYGTKQGFREENTFPIVEGDKVENHNYWVRDTLYLSD